MKTINMNTEIVTSAKDAGYRGALLNIRGINNESTDPFQLHRIPVYGDEPFEVFVCRLYGLI